MSLGIVLILIVIFGYISNWLNWRFLNYKATRFLYYIGAFIHESSHAILCLVTGAKVYEYNVISSQPHVTHGRPRLPLIGNLLISSAPIFGGLLFLFLVDHYLLGGRFAPAAFNGQWNSLLWEPLRLLAQMRPLEWQSWVMAILLINAGAMLGPSPQDIKNVWPLLIILLFVQSSFFAGIGVMALSLIMVNIVVQIVCVLCLKVMFSFIK
jgi:hypothetical protein